MKILMPLMLLVTGSGAVDHAQTYLLTIDRLPLKKAESVEAFSIKTWGVEFRAVCSIPSGWRIKAGGGATPDGDIDGEGSQGATWFNTPNPKELHNFVLVALYAPVQRANVGAVPATFQGKTTINSDDGDVRRALSYRNVTLTPAIRCPVQ